MAFTGDMRASLGHLSVCIIGVSGTGSMVAEQLARLGVGEIILIDFDKIEERNLNRILNATLANIGSLKVEIFADAIRCYRSDGEVISVPRSIATREAVLAASEADILFSCVDSAEGRHVADRLTTPADLIADKVCVAQAW
jgi:tRNA A37 threonylcarbamoyladenosine dehydratase